MQPHNVPSLVSGKLLKASRLPSEHLIGHTLESLAEHCKATALFIARTKVYVTQVAATSTAAPFCRQNHQIQRVNGLELEPAGTPSTSVVDRCRDFRKHPLVTGGQRLCYECLSFA